MMSTCCSPLGKYTIAGQLIAYIIPTHSIHTPTYMYTHVYSPEIMCTYVYIHTHTNMYLHTLNTHIYASFWALLRQAGPSVTLRARHLLTNVVLTGTVSEEKGSQIREKQQNIKWEKGKTTKIGV